MNKRNFGASNKETPYGEYDDNGRIAKDVAICALTGRPISPGDPLITVPGTNVFYRVSAVAWQAAGGKQAVLDTIEQRVKAPEDAAPVSPEAFPAASEPIDPAVVPVSSKKEK